MLYYYLLYFFIAVGAKLVLAMLMIYLLLPADTRCSGCDRESLLLRPGGLGLLGSKITFGHVQRRWCPSCGAHYLARRVPSRAVTQARHARIHIQTPYRAQWHNRP